MKTFGSVILGTIVCSLINAIGCFVGCMVVFSRLDPPNAVLTGIMSGFYGLFIGGFLGFIIGFVKPIPQRATLLTAILSFGLVFILIFFREFPTFQWEFNFIVKRDFIWLSSVSIILSLSVFLTSFLLRIVLNNKTNV